MTYTKRLYKILNSEKVTAGRDSRGNRTCRDTAGDFKGVRLSSIREVTDLVDRSIKDDIERTGVVFSSTQQVKDSVVSTLPSVIGMIKGTMPLSKLSLDSVVNKSLGLNTRDDFLKNNIVTPNIWISPWEANSLYSQKGIMEIVINKKGKSILLNGFKIKNPRLDVKDIDKVSENALRLQMPEVFSSAIVDGLCYGGDVLFPMFFKDTPLTMGLPISSLVKLGVVGKHCIDRFISLDRWNTWIIPPVSPTQRDYLEPDVYFIPFFGCDVHHSRTARIVPSPQAGWWGKTLTQGWGLSDFCGYYKSYEQYKIVMDTMPYMIQQMSILVRTINIDSALAMGGANILDSVLADNQIKMRRASPENPIDMDVTGDLKSINRNFGQVPEMTKMLRQAFAADAGIPEPMIFSSEKGNFSSGDDTQGNLSKQWESVKYIHKELESQLRRLAMLTVIDTLGISTRVMEALPYTTIQFDTPVIANATERATIAESLSKSFFNLVAGRMPMDKAAEISYAYGGEDMSLSSDTLDQLKKIQKERDEMDKQKFDAEIQQMDEKSEESPGGANANATVKNASGNTSKEKYTAIEQKQHEISRTGSTKRSEGLSKAEGKKVK